MTVYNPRCMWCGETENAEQGAVELTGPDGHFHEDCFERYLVWQEKVDRMESRFIDRTMQERHPIDREAARRGFTE